METICETSFLYSLHHSKNGASFPGKDTYCKGEDVEESPCDCVAHPDVCCPSPILFLIYFEFGNNSIKLAKTSNKQSPGDELAIVSGPLISSSILENCGSPGPEDQIKCLIGKILNKCIPGSLNLFVTRSNNCVVYISL